VEVDLSCGVIEDSIANKKNIAENILQKPTSSKSLSIQPDDQSNSLNRTSVALQDFTIPCTDMSQTEILASQTTFQHVREQTEMDSVEKVQFATKSHLTKFQAVENIALRTAVDVPWYVRNVDMQRDLKFTIATERIKQSAVKIFQKAKISYCEKQ